MSRHSNGMQRGGGAVRGPFHQVVALSVAVMMLGFGNACTAERPTAAGGSTPASSATSTRTTPDSERSSTTDSSTTTTTAPLGPSRITMAFAGDLLPHLPINVQAGRYGREHQPPQRFDFDPMLAPMAAIISGADVAVCHLETPVAPDQDRLTGYPSFGGPLELVDAVKRAGYDGCSNASNHSLDQGPAGVATTLDRFDQDGLHHAGTARSGEEALAITVYDVKGIKVAHLSYAYGFNGYQLPADAPWAANQIDPSRIKADAARARAGGASLVVVSLHWGTEYRSAPDEFQLRTGAALADSPDIDLIVGHHAHVVQPVGRLGDTYVIWGLGNHLANQRQIPRSDGLTAIASAERDPEGRWHVTGIEGIPTWVEPGTFRVLPVAPTLADPSISPGLRAELVTSYDRTTATVLRDHTPGVTVAARPG